MAAHILGLRFEVLRWNPMLWNLVDLVYKNQDKKKLENFRGSALVKIAGVMTGERSLFMIANAAMMMRQFRGERLTVDETLQRILEKWDEFEQRGDVMFDEKDDVPPTAKVYQASDWFVW